MITKKQKLSLEFALIQSLFLGAAYSHIFKVSSNDAWISIILGILIGLVIVYILKIILKYKGDKELGEFLQSFGKVGIIIKILLILLSFFFIYQMLMILQTFATSFFLIHTPPLFIATPIMLLSLLTIKSDKSILLKVVETLIVIIILTFILNILMLTPYGNFGFLLPILSTSSQNIWAGAIYFAIFSTSPLILLLNYRDDGKYILSTYLLSSIILLIFCIIIISVLGQELINIYRFPEYIVLKRVKIFDFIENIENIASIMWMFNEYILLTTSVENIKNLLPMKYKRIILYCSIILITFISSLLFGNNYTLELKAYNITPLILGIFIITVISLLMISILIKKNQENS